MSVSQKTDSIKLYKILIKIFIIVITVDDSDYKMQVHQTNNSQTNRKKHVDTTVHGASDANWRRFVDKSTTDW